MQGIFTQALRKFLKKVLGRMYCVQHFFALFFKLSFPPRVKYGVDSSGNPGFPMKIGIQVIKRAPAFTARTSGFLRVKHGAG